MAMNGNVNALPMFLCGMACGVIIGTLIGAIFLRAACSLYNKLAGGQESPSSVPEPSMGKAIGITFVTTLVNWGVGFLIGLAVGTAGVFAGADQRSITVVAQLLSLPISILVMAGMNAALLPTTFTRGLLVALCYLLVVVFVVVVLFLVIGAVVLVFSLLVAAR